jgi:hypothetical protein
MLTLGLIGFANPWMLTALVALPLIWLLLRLTPPAPRLQRFPAIRLLYDLTRREETPARTPWWLVLLRLTIAALIILALSQPVVNPSFRLAGQGPLLLVVDDGWAAARDWQARQRALGDYIERAERAQRPVVLVTTAAARDESRTRAQGPMRPTEVRAIAQALQPKPWPTDRVKALQAIDALGLEGQAEAVWLADGLADGAADDATRRLAERLQRFGGLTIVSPASHQLPRLLLAPDSRPAELLVPVERADGAGELALQIRAIATDGRMIAREPLRFAEGATRAELKLVLPTELRNEIARIDIDEEATAGAAALIDERWRRRPVGLIASTSFGTAQPLLDEVFYLDRALSPFAEVRRGAVSTLLQRDLAVVVVPDAAPLAPADRDRLTQWMKAGGVVLRFAGPHLAETLDELVPARLRRGDRTMGSALSWSQPAGIAPFDASSPFFGIPVPNDTKVRRQVLAEPTLDLGSRTWARLLDGTPFVTADRRDGGWLVLIHTTANADWSNVALSGLFVEMLQRIVALSQGLAGASGDQPLPPLQTLDGFGRMGAPPADAAPLAKGGLDAAVGPTSPPGFYGTELMRRALNLQSTVKGLKAMPPAPPGVRAADYAAGREIDLRGPLFAGALALGLVDILIALAMRGLIAAFGWGAAAILLTLWLPLGHQASAQTQQAQIRQTQPASPQAARPGAIDGYALEATLQMRLAYVITGQNDLDDISRAGMLGLSEMLNRRTAIEAAAPIAVDVESDELAFFALLYWPVSPDARLPTAAAVAKLNTYLRNGGTILFDTRDQGDIGPSGGGPGTRRLRQLTRGLDLPTLVPVPAEHVLTKAFYLMSEFPGRWAGGTVWVERDEGRGEVSSVIIGGNDWAGAWAIGQNGRHLFPVVPGGEQQREMAFRFGINLMMYALTGNYKADQVHVQTILERLGQ